MAKDRIEVCVRYICEKNPCKIGRMAEHRGYCQKCGKYEPRATTKKFNLKKQKLDKIKREERY